MGYFVTYDMRLEIKPKYFDQALKIFNNLHSREMLETHALGGKSPSGTKHYPWVINMHYDNLQQAFKNWNIIDGGGYVGLRGRRFVVEGHYRNKLGQQNFLLQQLAPVLSPTCVLVTGEDGEVFRWIIDNHTFREEEWSRAVLADDSDDDNENPSFDGGVGCGTSALMGSACCRRC